MDQEQLADLLLTRTRGSVCRGQTRRLVAHRFSRVFEGVAKASDSAPLSQIYTELHITEGGASEVNQEHEVRLVETTSRRPAAPETITCEELFKPRPHSPQPIRLVLTKGVAGVGKTVLTQKFGLDWAEGRAHQDLQLLFPFTFRDLNVLRDTQFSLEELLHHFFSPSKDLCSFQQLQVLFIFDGLDECRLPLDFGRTRVLSDPTESASVHVLLVNLIRGSLLPSALLWITTRPAAANQIPAECVSMVTEVRGFADPQKEQYFRKRFRDKHQANIIISHIKSVRSLHIMSHIPIFCWILSKVLQKLLEQTEPELPRTLTQMYVHFLVVQAKVQNIKYQQGSGEDLHWTPETREMVKSLGKVAFEQLQKGNLIFYESDLSECGLDAAAASVYSGVFTQVFREEPGLYQDKVYSFIHLSVQEFLAALHVHLTFFSSGENLLVEDGSESSDPVLFYKTAVETCVRRPNGHLDLFLRFLLGLSLPANQRLLRGLMSPTGSEATNQETVRYLQKKVSEEQREELSTEKVLNLFYCLSEMQDHSLVQQVQTQLRSGVLDPARFSSTQWAALVFLLLTSDRDLDLFDLRKFCPSEEALLHLLPVLQASTRAMLGGCHLSERSCSALGSVLVRSSLKELDLSNNDLEDCGVKQLCEGLKSDTCELQVLRLSLCHLSERSCSALGSVLVRSSLKELDLSNNDLEDCGVKQLCEGLKSDTCELQVLRLSGCLVTQSGCSSLAAALTLNPTHLQELDLSFNHPGIFGTETLKNLRDDPRYSLHTLRLDPQSVWWKMPGLAKYSCEPRFDLTTANFELKVLEKKPEVQFTEEQQKYPQHPQRFDWYPQS
ncbi:protein NLRC3-like [Boleophthalmus pectinirostris]|uniref:protein NLRC3-like n=1 Tax=Boleophthalmus pectinirostris TaxID=150288 RepID=UPI00242CD0AD|nr:protein NLRC3-like [Boleophthalmus pectinirostris]